MRVPNVWLESVAFMYQTEADARASRNVGGSGFIIGVAARDHGRIHSYLVTNRHVAQQCFVARTVRGELVYGIAVGRWIYHPDGDDVAVALIPENVFTAHMSMDMFLTPDLVAELDLGPGDEAFILGRFIGLDRTTRNTPTTRFGHLSMAGTERIRTPFGIDQESLVFEMRTLAGYSGSPVFVEIPPIMYGPYASAFAGLPETQQPKRRPGVWLAGVEWGNIVRLAPVLVGPQYGPPQPLDDHWVRENSGMSGVVPAWKIRELLDGEEATADRLEVERRRSQDAYDAPQA